MYVLQKWIFVSYDMQLILQKIKHNENCKFHAVPHLNFYEMRYDLRSRFTEK